MFGWCKLIDENDKKMKIGYSLEKNKNCDGILIYDKQTQEFFVEKLPKGEDGWLTNHFICPLRNRLRRKPLTSELSCVATG